MSTVFQDISVSITQRRYACVIDPLLALSPFGLTLTRQLSMLLDTWMPRGLRHIIDNTSMYLHFPHQLPNITLMKSVVANKLQQQSLLSILQEWEPFQNTPHDQNKLFYFADALLESSLPEKFDSNTIWQFEALSSSLDKYLQDSNPLLSACRDALALVVTIPSAIILTQIDAEYANDDSSCLQDQEGIQSLPQNSAPLLCQHADQWNIPVIPVNPDDDWLRIERDFIRQQLVLAGVAKFQWYARSQQPGLRLAVLHIVTPSASLAITQPTPDFGNYSAIEPLKGDEGESPPNYWQGAKGFWYTL